MRRSHRPFLGLLALLAVASSSTSAGSPRQAAPSPLLRYSLHLSGGPTTRWVPNLLLVPSALGAKMSGQVHLQFGIGPEARMPQVWERTQVLDLSGTFDARTARVDLTVTAVMGRGKVRFRFRGYRITQGADGFAGIYFVDGRERGGFLALRSGERGVP